MARTTHVGPQIRTCPSWVELDGSAYVHNLVSLRRILAPGTELMAVVKANAYGHGMRELAPLAARHADALGVNSLDEAAELLGMGLGRPIHVLGPSEPRDLEAAAILPLEFTVATTEALDALARGATRDGARPRCHVKIETGCHRQGFLREEMEAVLERFARHPQLVWAGLCTHFANVEDTTDHSYARLQLESFLEVEAWLRARGLDPGKRHAACTAAALVMPESHLDMARLGVGTFGLWPSGETLVSARDTLGPACPELRPVLTWKTRILQLKTIPAQSFVGYGCTVRTTRRTRLALLPVGYADGYDRGLSNNAHVLVRGRRAPVMGRVCMNMTMVDVTDVPGVAPGDEVVLLGRQGDEVISAESLARRLHTIVYEVTTRIAAGVPRRLVSMPEGPEEEE
jgi:alanine racemase